MIQAAPHQSTNESQAEISIEGMDTHYANMIRGMMTPEEVILDFGINPNVGGKMVDEKIRVHSRVILTISSAVRLHQLLQAMLTKRQEAIQQAATGGGGQDSVPGE